MKKDRVDRLKDLREKEKDLSNDYEKMIDK